MGSLSHARHYFRIFFHIDYHIYYSSWDIHQIKKGDRTSSDKWSHFPRLPWRGDGRAGTFLGVEIYPQASLQSSGRNNAFLSWLAHLCGGAWVCRSIFSLQDQWVDWILSSFPEVHCCPCWRIREEALIQRPMTFTVDKALSYSSTSPPPLMCTAPPRRNWKWKSLSCVWLFVTPWTVACQATSVYGILQARMLESVAVPFSRGSSRPRDQTWFSHMAGRFFTVCATRKAQDIIGSPQNPMEPCFPEVQPPKSAFSLYSNVSLWAEARLTCDLMLFYKTIYNFTLMMNAFGLGFHKTI